MTPMPVDKIESLKAMWSDMYCDHTIGEGLYYRGLIGVAYEYGLLGDVEGIKSTLAVIPPRYYEQQIKDDIYYDEHFATQALDLAKKIRIYNIVEDGPLDFVEGFLQRRADA